MCCASILHLLICLLRLTFHLASSLEAGTCCSEAGSSGQTDFSSFRRMHSAVENIAAGSQQGNEDKPSIGLGRGLTMPHRSAVGSNGARDLQPTQQGLQLQAPIDRWACVYSFRRRSRHLLLGR